MGPKRKPAASAQPSAPEFSISRKYTGSASSRELTEAYIARGAELKTRSELARSAIQAGQKGAGSDGITGLAEAARDLVKTAKGVSSDIKTLTQEVQEMREVITQLSDTVTDVEAHGLIAANMIDQRQALLDEYDALRTTFASLMGPTGAVTIHETATLRAANTDLAREVDGLRSQEQALKSQLVSTYQARAAAATIEGVELPEWFPRDAEDGTPAFEIIEDALDRLSNGNKALTKRCLELQRANKAKSEDYSEIRADKERLSKENASLKTKLEELTKSGDWEAAMLKADVVEAKAQRDRDRQHVDEARHERERHHKERMTWVQATTKLENQVTKLQQQCEELSNKNAQLEAKVAGTNQASIEAILKESNRRFEEQQKRDNQIIESIKQNADERVATNTALLDRARQEAQAAAERITALEASSNVSATIIEQAKAVSEDMKTRTQEAEARADKATAELQQCKEEFGHLKRLQGTVMDSKEAAVRDKDGFEKKLKATEEEVRVLEKVKVDLEEKLRAFAQAQEIWRADQAIIEKIDAKVMALKEERDRALQDVERLEADLKYQIELDEADQDELHRIAMED